MQGPGQQPTRPSDLTPVRTRQLVHAGHDRFRCLEASLEARIGRVDGRREAKWFVHQDDADVDDGPGHQGCHLHQEGLLGVVGVLKAARDREAEVRDCAIE